MNDYRITGDFYNGGVTITPVPKLRRGFAAMTPEQRRAIASKGGKSAHAKGVAHHWTRETAVAAGRKGGKISRGRRGRLPENGE